VPVPTAPTPIHTNALSLPPVNGRPVVGAATVVETLVDVVVGMDPSIVCLVVVGG
jgi:hypothetical protein